MCAAGSWCELLTKHQAEAAEGALLQFYQNNGCYTGIRRNSSAPQQPQAVMQHNVA
jgi:hypothetical protein